MKLADVKEKRKAERYADQKSRDDRKPKPSHTEAAALGKNENPQHERRNNDVNPEEACDAVWEKFMNEKRKVQSVLQKPRHKLPIRQGQAKDAQSQVNMTQSQPKGHSHLMRRSSATAGPPRRVNFGERCVRFILQPFSTAASG